VLIRVLGSAAGGGFPQWNCGCPNCDGLRSGSVRAKARSQESVAVSADGANWFLLNASPEVRAQIESFAGLHPRAPRDTPIQGIVLTNGDLDHCLGLLSLRESQPLVLYATDSVRRGFTENNVLFRTLERFDGQVTWRTLRHGASEPLTLADGSTSGLEVCAFAIPGKAPVHLMSRGATAEDNVGLRIGEARSKKALAYLPAVGAMAPAVEQAIKGADAVFFDGTFWSSDELPSQGLGEKRAEDMAHWPVGGANGSLSMLRELAAPHRILIHINNTNPLLRDDSPERAAADAAGVAVAYDGMELSL
jgi:pyrroloquinoline quinone biosynthesis protein B